MLPRNQRQEMLSRAYVQIVAAACGMSCSTREMDYGFDITLHEIQEDGKRISETGFVLDIQAKSTSAPRWKSDELLFDVPIANYDDLRKPGKITPRILVVLTLPRSEAEWASLTDNQLILRHAAYWMSLVGLPAVPNKRSVRVALPRANLFDPAALAALVGKLSKGGQP